MCLCAYIYNHNDVRIPISRIDDLVIGHVVMQAGAANGLEYPNVKESFCCYC